MNLNKVIYVAKDGTKLTILDYIVLCTLMLAFPITIVSLAVGLYNVAWAAVSLGVSFYLVEKYLLDT